MSELAIRVDGLGKRYRISATQRKYKTLRDSVMAAVRQLGARIRGDAEGAGHETIWALRDVSFEVQRGEVVGIIGLNGAGKSTLLRLLARITEPSAGRGEVHGRVGSLLEVGTGFHQELTGRENVFLSGVILGMSRAEITRKFDEIVAFAEMEKFIDTPVKHYSSGMYTRLAFSVAAHLDPEILIVDEVLAVGDTRFQKKCLTKMSAAGRAGRTVLFVSHNMGTIARLCSRALLLEGGRLVQDGPSHEVVSAYLHGGSGTTAAREWSDAATAPGRDVARLRAVRARAGDGGLAQVVDVRQAVTIEMEYDVLQPGFVLLPQQQLFNEEGVHVCSLYDTDPAWRKRDRPVGRWITSVTIPANFLAEGMIFVRSVMGTLNPTTEQFSRSEAVAFRVVDAMEGPSARGDFTGTIEGIVRPLLPWTNRMIPEGEHAAAESDEGSPRRARRG
jgi:lipopolysaccharide transport system ATP-binding protein